jgi:hypothetical protein
MSYHLSKLFIHSQIIIATAKKAEWHSTRSDLPPVEAEITTERCSRALLFAPADAIIVTRQPVSVGHRGRSAVTIAEMARGIDNQADARH